MKKNWVLMMEKNGFRQRFKRSSSRRETRKRKMRVLIYQKNKKNCDKKTHLNLLCSIIRTKYLKNLLVQKVYKLQKFPLICQPINI